MDEKRAIKLCLAHRDPRGFEHLYKTYRRNAYFHALALMGNPEDAVDACQESFTRAYRAMPGLKHLEAFYPWFYTILRNCCLNMLSRRNTAMKHGPGRSRSPDTDGVEPSRPDGILMRKEEQARVWQTLRALKPAFREILLMKYMEGASYNDISDRLNIPKGTVMSRLFHARKAFKEAHLQIRG